uniref:Uncharacterized protein n=1 Tax=Oryza barthii TaxID=65489 RepID=A0A0D3H3X5_9ORYZ
MPCLLALLALEHLALDPAGKLTFATHNRRSSKRRHRLRASKRTVGSGSSLGGFRAVPRRLVLTNGVAAAVIITITDLFSQRHKKSPRRLMLTNGVAAAAIITVTDLSSQVGFMYLLTRSATNRNAQIEDKYKYAVTGNGNQQRGRWRRTARKAAASAEGDDACAEGSSAHGREGRKEERGSSSASMAVGPEDESGGDGLAMRRGGRAASTPKERAERG